MITDKFCSLCLRDDLPLVLQDIPPRSLFNNRRVQPLTPVIDETAGLTTIAGGYKQFGSGVYVLCADCNSLLARVYVPAYREFEQAVASKVVNDRGTVSAMERITDPDMWPKGTLEFCSDEGFGGHGFYPTRIAKQALWTLLGVSPPEVPAQRAQLVSLVLDQNGRSVPEGVRLGFCFFIADRARVHGVGGISDLQTGEHRVLAEVSHPPLSWVLVVNGASLPDGMVDVTDWLTLGSDHTLIDFRIEARLGFGNTLYPADYRTVGQIEPQAENAGG